jgi:AraC-like DNA-binding protein
MRKKVVSEKYNSIIHSLKKDILPTISPEFNSNISERKVIALLDSASICTKVLDLDFNLQYMSPSGINSLKIDDITVFYDQPYPFSFYPQSFRECTTKNLIKAVKTNKVIEQEASVVDTKGKELWFHSIIAPVESSNGQIESIVVISIDTTQKRKTELESSECNQTKKYMDRLPLVDEHTIKDPDNNFMVKVQKCVEANISDSGFDVNALAKQLFMSRSTLQRKLSKNAGISAALFIRQIRLATAHEFIQKNIHRTLAETAHTVGFKQPGYFSKLYKKYLSTVDESKQIPFTSQPLEHFTQNIDEYYDNMLLAGLEALSLTLGVISRIKNDLYEIVAVISDNDVFVPGEVFRLHDTYCRQVIEKSETLALTELGGCAGLEQHPLYDKMPLEVYIGTPSYTNGLVWGPLNVCSMMLI